jgi:pimeloyl-ACP methyl ester carboxylesterase
MTGDSGNGEVIEGSVEANGLRFGYLQAGESGPLALCLHGFPDSARTWRYLLPALADAGYRAVAPWLRGYAPTQVPDIPHYDVGTLALDANAMHEALGGNGDAVLIGHDWGAIVGYTAVHATPARWRRLVTMAVPPPGAVAAGFLTYDQLQRSWYMFFFQHPLSDIAVAMGDLAFIDRLWADWSPGYNAVDDLPGVKDAMRDPGNLAAALGYYRAMLGDRGVSDDPAAVGLRGAANNAPPLPTLYLHGKIDGCLGADLVGMAPSFLTYEGSRSEIVDDAGHFLHVERPDEVNRLVLDFIA